MTPPGWKELRGSDFTEQKTSVRTAINHSGDVARNTLLKGPEDVLINSRGGPGQCVV